MERFFAFLLLLLSSLAVTLTLTVTVDAFVVDTSLALISKKTLRAQQQIKRITLFTTSGNDNEEKARETQNVPSLQNSVIPQRSMPQPKQLDPLVRSLTRMDAETKDAPTILVPLWGELILDKSLYVLAPVVLFAVLGFGLSINVALNASDDWIVTPSTSKVVKTDYSCRGLCAQQDADLERLSAFMQQFAKK